MEGKRITVYLPAGVHEEMREVAWGRRMSLSGYIVELHRVAIDSAKPIRPVGDGVKEYKPKPAKISDPAGDPYFKSYPKKGGKK